MGDSIQLTVVIPSTELDALRFACAATDESVFVHEDTDDRLVSTVTLQVRSVEMLFYLVRTFDAKVDHNRAIEWLRKAPTF